ncbi:MAG: hypothetical protein O3A00_04160 [Planctomycetota bacterium]|nr:hypothetical protein [Planctomycetota bacterium]
MRTLQALWTDESGSVLSAEAVALATIAVLGATIGMTTAVNAVDEEWADFARMMRSLDQSFSFSGLSCTNAQFAGSAFTDNVSADVAGVTTTETEQINELMNDTDQSVKTQAKPEAKSQSTIQNEQCPTPAAFVPNATTSSSRPMYYTLQPMSGVTAKACN